MHLTPELSIVVLISGNGSNLQSIIDAIEAGRIRAKISAVISNNPDAYGLSRAKKHGIQSQVIDHREHASRDQFDLALLDCIESHTPDYIILAGFMRILGSALIQANPFKMLNIHPSLLPEYKGMNTHARALQNRESEHGVSIHIVTAELDDGPVIMRGRYPVEPMDSVTDLQNKGHRLEHQMYPQVLQWLADGSLRINSQSIVFQGHKLIEPIEYLPRSTS